MVKSDLNQKVLKNLDVLKEREQEVLALRFGLTGDSQKTLQAIGKKYDITRERVRQIVNQCFKKLKQADNKTLNDLSKKIEITLKKHGDLIPDHNLAYQISPRDRALKSLGAIEIICRINPKLVKLKKTPKTQNFWAKKGFTLNKIIKINKALTKILNKSKKTQSTDYIARAYNKKNKNKLTSEAIHSIALGSHNLIVTTSNKIGLASWPKINPKNTKDKIYFILKQAKKPLHFSEITTLMHEKKFATRNPTQTTVHNELISDSRFVLIGRGIYALKEWGFEKGTVLDLLKKLLKKYRSGLDRDKICETILEKRMISKNTVLMNLNSQACFVKTKNGHWRLKQ